MVEILEEKVIDLKSVGFDLSKAGVIGIRDGKEYIVSESYPIYSESGIRVYSCDADCDNCHCATY